MDSLNEANNLLKAIAMPRKSLSPQGREAALTASWEIDQLTNVLQRELEFEKGCSSENDLAINGIVGRIRKLNCLVMIAIDDPDLVNDEFISEFAKD